MVCPCLQPEPTSWSTRIGVQRNAAAVGGEFSSTKVAMTLNSNSTAKVPSASSNATAGDWFHLIVTLCFASTADLDVDGHMTHAQPKCAPKKFLRPDVCMRDDREI